MSAAVKPARTFAFRVAKPVRKGEAGYWSTRARSARQLFPSDTLVIPKGGNAAGGKLELRSAPHLGKRDVIEYLRKVYNVKPTKVNSLNFPGKLKRASLKRGVKIYRTKAFKKFMVTLDKDFGVLPEHKLGGPVEGEVVKKS